MMRKIILFTMTILFAVWLVSCSKTPQPDFTASQVAGTYQGFLTATNFKTAGTANINPVNDSMVSIHCYDSVGFDTTFIMEIYLNGDSVMLCNTGQDFDNQYGHYMTGPHHMFGSMMGQSNGMNDWQQHMSSQHQPGDKHYGGFDLHNGTFNYLFVMSDSLQTKNFSGKKN